MNEFLCFQYLIDINLRVQQTLGGNKSSQKRILKSTNITEFYKS